MNIAVVRGTLSSDPRIRELGSGTRLASLEVTVRVEGEPAASVPVAWFDPGASALARCQAGSELVIVGRVRRRFYRTPGGTGSATEVVAERVIPVSSRVRVRRLLTDVGEQVTGLAASC